MMPTFNVYAEIVTPESAEHGDAESRETIGTGLRLRDAVDEFFRTRTNAVCGIEGIEDTGHWFSLTNGMEFETGAQEGRTLHPYPSITASSYARLARLLGARS